MSIKIVLALCALALTAGVVFVLTRTTPNVETACTLEARLCPDGSYVGRTGPSCEFAPCPLDTEVSDSIPADIRAHIDAKKDLIRLASPTPLSSVTSPLTITGEARGYWFFEGSFPITIVDWDGLIIGEGFATADGEWMTEEFVPFTATIPFQVGGTTPYPRGTLILRKDNPSGDPSRDDALEIPVNF